MTFKRKSTFNLCYVLMSVSEVVSSRFHFLSALFTPLLQGWQVFVIEDLDFFFKVADKMWSLWTGFSMGAEKIEGTDVYHP